jgi:hypothetical protein
MICPWLVTWMLVASLLLAILVAGDGYLGEPRDGIASRNMHNRKCISEELRAQPQR